MQHRLHWFNKVPVTTKQTTVMMIAILRLEESGSQCNILLLAELCWRLTGFRVRARLLQQQGRHSDTQDPIPAFPLRIHSCHIWSEWCLLCSTAKTEAVHSFCCRNERTHNHKSRVSRIWARLELYWILQRAFLYIYISNSASCGPIHLEISPRL